jgi:hypothetical protein
MILEKVMQKAKKSAIALGVVGALTLGTIGLTSADQYKQPKQEPSIQQISYVQNPIRNEIIPTEIDWYVQYTTDNPSLTAKYCQDSSRYITSLLNNDAVIDNNTFVPFVDQMDGKHPHVILRVYEYTNNNPSDYENYLMADFFAFGHKGSIHKFTTGYYPLYNTAQRDQDLADQVYYWIHNGWHNNDWDAE